MRIDTQTIQSLAVQPIATSRSASDAMPRSAFASRAARWLSIAATVLATTTAVLLACGLAVMLNLS